MKKLTALLLAILMLATLCACGGKESVNKENEKENTQNDSNNIGVYKEHLDNLCGYEKIFSTPYQVVTDYETPYSIDKDGNYYTIQEEKIKFAAKPEKFFSASNDIAYWDADGNFYVYPCETPFTVDSNLIYALRLEEDNYIFYSLKDGNLYITKYYNGNCVASNEPLELIVEGYELNEDPKIVSYMFSSKYVVLWLNDGNCYYDTINYDKDYYTSEWSTSIDNKIDNVDKVFSCLSFFDSPIYSKTNDTNKLFFSFTDDDYQEFDVTVTLPEEYTTSDIKKVHVQPYATFITFNDGGVYYVLLTEIKSENVVLHCDEVLSKLNKEGHMLSIVNIDQKVSNNCIVGVWVNVLMDDLCYYSRYHEINFE